MTFFKNGDPYFPGVVFRFRPGRDVVSLESLLDKLSSKMDLPRGARFIFNMDGAQIMNLEDLEDGGWYVVSSFKSFKVRNILLFVFHVFELLHPISIFIQEIEIRES